MNETIEDTNARRNVNWRNEKVFLSFEQQKNNNDKEINLPVLWSTEKVNIKHNSLTVLA